jgi:hypothetical protein|tara:strand:- start:368 stop:646 length:279 start_codon:yes stop_codon:yes gene_type:complete
MKKKWKNGLVNMEKEISELTDNLDELKVRYRGVNRLIDGKNIHIIKGEKQNRLKIIFKGKSFWFHLPFNKYEKSVMKIRSDFINKILQGEIL